MSKDSKKIIEAENNEREMSNNEHTSAFEQEPLDNSAYINSILQKRAEILALEIQESEFDEKSINIVEFKLNNETYALDTIYTKMVASLKDITPVPCTPEYVIGVTGIHEQIISVLNIKCFFQMAQNTDLNRFNKIIILERHGVSFAIIADDIIGIRNISADTIQKSIDTFDDIRKKYFFGLTNDQTIILDGAKILDDPEIIVK